MRATSAGRVPAGHHGLRHPGSRGVVGMRSHHLCAAAASVRAPQRRCACRSAPAAQQQQLAAAAAAHAALPPLLGDVRVVLVAPKEPGNVGAVARACANFEALDLCVVAPRCDPRDGAAYARAVGPRVLDGLTVVDSLGEALADTTSSIGFTRRAGRTRLTHASIGSMLRDFPDSIPGMAPPPAGEGDQQHAEALAAAAAAAAAGRRAGQQHDGEGGEPSTSGSGGGEVDQRRVDAVWAAVARQGRTALVFGREESGLTEDELRLCTHACAIPTGRVQGSMNLSHAVGVVLANLFERRLEALGLEEVPMGQEILGGVRSDDSLQPASAAELEALLAKAAAIARAVGVSPEESYGGGNQGTHGRRRLPLGHMRSILARAKASTWEVRSLHGLASSTLKALGVEGRFSGSGGEESGGGSGSESS